MNLGAGTDIICERQSCVYNSFTTCSRGTVRIGSTCLDYIQGEFTGEIIEDAQESSELIYPKEIED